MKQKKLNRTLVFNKKTVTNLDNPEMGRIYGGDASLTNCPGYCSVVICKLSEATDCPSICSMGGHCC